MRLFGFNTTLVSSGARLGEAAPLDIVLLMDVSASQCEQTSNTDTSGSGWCSRLQNPSNPGTYWSTIVAILRKPADEPGLDAPHLRHSHQLALEALRRSAGRRAILHRQARPQVRPTGAGELLVDRGFGRQPIRRVQRRGSDPPGSHHQLCLSQDCHRRQSTHERPDRRREGSSLPVRPTWPEASTPP